MAQADPLAEYNAKRDFRKTREPQGEGGEHGGNRFIVQKHDATRLHWDLRLEADGVLKSWAVTKGPSPDPDVKRLAVRTEDHPLSYADFEGTIPAEEYGGGTVMLWDRGTWEPVAGKSAADIDEGHLHFILHGERMKGEWLLIRMNTEGKRENWLLRKLEDQHAEEGDALVERELTSVSTGRSMAAIARDEDGSAILSETRRGTGEAGGGASEAGGSPSHGKRGQPPAFRKPQLATLVDSVPGGNGWMHEIKFDGYRALIAASGDRVAVYTRSGKDWTDRFGPVVEAVAALDLPPCLIDGEIVATDADGNPDFSALQQALGDEGGGAALQLHAFDLLELDGADLTDLPNIERKERLEALLAQADPPLHVAQHVIGAGEKLYRAMCDARQEGIISKRVDARYSGRRSSAWVKVKCTLRQEFVVIGYKASSATGRPFASLLLAQHEDGELVYRGNVGTGFTEDTLDELATTMHRLERKTPPAEVDTASRRHVTWLTPRLVAEIAFAEFTAEGKVRHASLLGLRGDKDASEVVPERPAPSDGEEAAGVQISSRERVVFPESGETKGDLADYYDAVAAIMLPFAARRPISLVRCPQGRAKKCFFQKHDSGGFGDAVRAVPIREKDGGTEEYLFVEDRRGLLQCVQMGTIEFHGWAARTGDVEAPDRLIFDLDPDEGLGFDAVKGAARDIRDRLAEMGMVGFAMLSGGKGVHVIVPLRTGHGWDAHADFARRFAEALSQAEPERFTATMSKAKREGRIFIDWLRNQRGSTAVVPYSARARARAPVAAPIAWDELDETETAARFGIGDAQALIERAQGGALAGWGFADQPLPDL